MQSILELIEILREHFTLTHKNDPVFERYFDGNDTSIVSVSANTIRIPNHFFVTGEELKYYHAGIGSTQAIEIANTTFPLLESQLKTSY